MVAGCHYNPLVTEDHPMVISKDIPGCHTDSSGPATLGPSASHGSNTRPKDVPWLTLGHRKPRESFGKTMEHHAIFKKLREPSKEN